MNTIGEINRTPSESISAAVRGCLCRADDRIRAMVFPFPSFSYRMVRLPGRLMLDRYVVQVRLAVDVLPETAVESAFALKGGTAINLFHRDLQRLSVDIDIAWLPMGDRSTALREIDNALDLRLL